MRKIIPLITGCALLLALGACGGSRDEPNPDRTATTQPESSESPPAAATAESGDVTPDQLAVMVLPLDAYGSHYAGFDIDDDSGVQDANDAVDDTANPDDKAADVEARGFVTGYDLAFSDPDIFQLGLNGVFEVDSAVQVFTTDATASAYISKEVADEQALLGQDLGGYSFKTLETFDVASIGDESLGLELSADFGGQTLYGATVVFRVGSLVASVTRSATVSIADREPVVEWARSFEDRITQSLDGTLDEDPVPLPTPEHPAAAAPEAPPYPEAMVLSLDDMPERTTVDSEGYFEDDDGQTAYSREFNVNATGAIGITSEVVVYDDDQERQLHFQRNETLIGDQSYWDNAAATIASQAGGEPGDVQITVLDTDVGDESLAYRMVMHSDIGEYEAYYYLFTVGRAVGSLQVTSFGSVDPAEVLQYADTMVQRMAAELARAP